jgi:hypothetical protein
MCYVSVCWLKLFFVVLLFAAKFEEFASEKMWLEVQLYHSTPIGSSSEEEEEEEEEEEDEEHQEKELESERGKERAEEGGAQEMERRGGVANLVREAYAKRSSDVNPSRSLRTSGPTSDTSKVARKLALQRAEELVRRSIMCTEPTKGGVGSSHEEEDNEEEEGHEEAQDKLLSNHASVLPLEESDYGKHLDDKGEEDEDDEEEEEDSEEEEDEEDNDNMGLTDSDDDIRSLLDGKSLFQMVKQAGTSSKNKRSVDETHGQDKVPRKSARKTLQGSGHRNVASQIAHESLDPTAKAEAEEAKAPTNRRSTRNQHTASTAEGWNAIRNELHKN